MDVSHFPTATLTLSAPIDLGSIPAEGAVADYNAMGNLTMHGVTKSVSFPVTAERTGSAIAVLADVPITFSEWNIANPSIAGFVTTANTGTLEVLLHLTQGPGNPVSKTSGSAGSVGGGGRLRRRAPPFRRCASLRADPNHPARADATPLPLRAHHLPVGAAQLRLRSSAATSQLQHGYGQRVTARQFPERIRDNRQPAPERRPQQIESSSPQAATAHRLGSGAGVVRAGRRVRPVHRPADLRGGSRRLPASGRKVRLHIPPVFLRAPEYEPSVHVSPVCCTAFRTVAEDVRQCRIGAGGLDNGQLGCTDRRARPVCTSGQAFARRNGHLAPRTGVEPARRASQPRAHHDRLRPGQPVRDLPRHVGPPERTPHRKAPAASWRRHRAGRCGQAHSPTVRPVSR